LFISTGHPHYNLRAGLAVTAVLVPGMLLLLPWGIVGVAYAVVIAHAIGLVYNVFQVQAILPRTVRAMVAAALPSFGSSVIMALCVMGVRAAMPELHMTGAKYVVLGSLVASGAVVYLGLFALTQRPLMKELVELIRPRGPEAR
jgi:Na+-driven multidrug efflux pump